jgi:type VI secretion system protein ImpH
MANKHRTSSDSLDEKLLSFQAKPHQFSLFSAVRRLDCLFRKQPRTGTSERPSLERLRIGQEPTLEFAPASIAGFKQRDSDKTWHLQTFFFGLFGPNGPLPTHITDFAEQRTKQQHDETFARFADVFHHRMACFFYRAWSASQPTVHMDRPESDRFAAYVAALCGIGTPALRNRDAMPDNAKLYFCAQLACTARHSSGLRSILNAFFQAPVEIIPFVSHWVQLPEDCLWKLGQKRTAGELGVSVSLGARVRDCQQKFRIALGPIDYELFSKLLPFGNSMRRLRAIVDQYVGQEFSWDVQLVLQRHEVPRISLGKRGHLGWTTWLSSREPREDANHLIVDPFAESRRTKKLALRDSVTLSQDL